MNKALKVVERQIEQVYQELTLAKNDPQCGDKAYVLLRAACIDAINLKRKVEEARGWNIQEPKSNSA